MPKQLVSLEIDEISAVDKGANRKKWLVIKNADDSDPAEVEKKALTVQQVLDHDEALEHACEDKYEIINAYMRSMHSILESDTDASEQETLAVQSTREFVALMRPIIEVLNESEEVMMADKKTDVEKSEEQEMESRLAALEAQTQELQGKLEAAETEKADLAKQLEDAKAAIAKTAEEPEDIWKGVHPEVKKRFEAQQEQIEKAEAIAKAERERREKQECIQKAAGYQSLPINPDDDWTLFKDIMGLPEKTQKRIEQIFSAANTQLKENRLLKTDGVDPNIDEVDDSAVAKATRLASQVVQKSEGLSLDAALGRVFSENPGLYAQYIRETQVKA